MAHEHIVKDFDWIQDGPDEHILKYSREIAAKHAHQIEVGLNEDIDCESVISFLPEVEADPIIRLRGKTCSREAAVHELLHLWRYLVCRIPRVVGEYKWLTAQHISDIDNMIEHSIIVPMQTALGYVQLVEQFEAQELLNIKQTKTEDLQADPYFITQMIIKARALRPAFEKHFQSACQKADLEMEYRVERRRLLPFTAHTTESKQALLNAIFPPEFKLVLGLHYPAEYRVDPMQ